MSDLMGFSFQASGAEASTGWVVVGDGVGASRPSVHVAVQAEYQLMNSIHLGFSSFFCERM